MTLDMDAPRLSVGDGQDEVALTGLALNLVQDVGAEQTLTSHLDMGIEEVAVQVTGDDDTPGGTGRLAGVALTSKGSFSGELGDLEVSMGLDSARFQETRIGASHLEMAFRRIDIAAMYDYAQQVQEMQQSGLTPEQLNARMPALLMDIGPKLLASSPEMDFEVASKRPEDADLRVSGTVSFNGEGRFQLLNMPDMMSRTRLTTDLHLPQPMVRTLVEDVTRQQIRAALEQQNATASDARIAEAARQQAQQTLQVFEQQGYIERAEGAYETAFRLEKGQMTLNGRSLSGVTQGM